MIYEESLADKSASLFLFMTSNPVFKAQTKGIIVRIGGAVKVISRRSCLGKLIDNREKVVLHCI